MLFAASRSWVAKVALWRTILSTKSLNCSSSATKHALGQAFYICIFSKLKTNVVCSFSVKFGGCLSMDCRGMAFLYIYILIALNQISQSLTFLMHTHHSAYLQILGRLLLLQLTSALCLQVHKTVLPTDYGALHILHNEKLFDK